MTDSINQNNQGYTGLGSSRVYDSSYYTQPASQSSNYPMQQTMSNQQQYYQPPKPKENVTKVKFTGCLFSGICFGLGIMIVLVLLSIGCAYLARFSDGEFNGDNRQVATKTVIESGDEHCIVAVVRIKGIIQQGNDGLGECSAQRVCTILKEICDDEDIVGILLDMDTPGGEVVAADEIYTALKDCRNRGKFIVTCMHSMGASGGYYIACASNHIVANRMTMTGSVGVIMSSFNVRELSEKIGVKPVVFKSGAMKDMLSMSRDMNDTERSYVQSLVDGTFMEFAKIVAAGRPKYKDANAVREAEFGDGRVVSGDHALELGLIDQLGDMETAMDKCVELTGGKGIPSFIRYDIPVSVWDKFLTVKSSLSPVNSLVQLPGYKLQAGRMYFIAPECAQ